MIGLRRRRSGTQAAGSGVSSMLEWDSGIRSNPQLRPKRKTALNKRQE
jgi:hypothetical protein